MAKGDSMVDILALGAHPDDVEIGTAGLLAKSSLKGHSVGILDLTYGEKGSQGTMEKRWKEALKSSRILGCAFRECLGMPDTEISDDIENRRRLAESIRFHCPSIILAPYFSDRHPDHAACGKLAFNASFISGLWKAEISGEPSYVKRIVYYMIHDEFVPSFYVDITEVFDRRMEALKTFASQFERRIEGHNYIGISDYPYFVEARCRLFGAKIGKKAAEAFYVKDGIVLEDVLKDL